MARIEVQQLTKVFRGSAGEVIRAADLVDLTVEPGELLVLTGPSGCGKTTLLRLIAGLEEADCGRILADGQLMNAWAPAARDVAMVFQTPALFPHLTVYQNIAFGLRVRKIARAEIDGRVREAADAVGLSECLHRLPAQLSGGQQQRTALARALVRRARVLLLDEPLSGLDAPLRRQLRGEIRRLHERFRTTAIYVTHDQQEALAIGDRIAVMREGKILQAAPPGVIYAKPACVFVARFIGWPPMNLVRGKLLVERIPSSDDGSAGAGSAVLVVQDGVGRELLRVPVPDPPDALKAYAGKELIVGVHAEHVVPGILTEAEAAGGRGHFVVGSAEVTGAQKLLCLQAEGLSLTAEVPPGIEVRRGEHVSVRLNSEGLLFFEAQSEARVG